MSNTGPKKATEVVTENLCDHGCGQVAKFLNLSGKYLCYPTSQKCPAVKAKNSEGARKAYSDGVRVSGKERYSILEPDIKDAMAWSRDLNPGTDFCYGGGGNHKKVLISERGHQCEECKLTEWNSKPIPLELEHSDGDNRNNDRENLKLLCCNCHALTPTWRGRNINSGKVKVSDQELLTALKECSNIRQALQKVGLTPKGGNYARASRLLATVV